MEMNHAHSTKEELLNMCQQRGFYLPANPEKDFLQQLLEGKKQSLMACKVVTLHKNITDKYNHFNMSELFKHCPEMEKYIPDCSVESNSTRYNVYLLEVFENLSG